MHLPVARVPPLLFGWPTHQLNIRLDQIKRRQRRECRIQLVRQEMPKILGVTIGCSVDHDVRGDGDGTVSSCVDLRFVCGVCVRAGEGTY
jgi:hypothetical protein